MRVNVYSIIAIVTSSVLVGISLFLAESGSTYQWSFLFLLPLVWSVYFLRDALALLPFHFALFALAIVIHDLGSLGFYNRSLVGLRFDTYVHFGFGLVAGLVLFHAAREKSSISPKLLAIGVPIFILGLGGIHELFECLTTLLLGPERGMLKLRPDEPFDTQKDLLNNLCGAVLAILISLRHGTKVDPKESPLQEVPSAPSQGL